MCSRGWRRTSLALMRLPDGAHHLLLLLGFGRDVSQQSAPHVFEHVPFSLIRCCQRIFQYNTQRLQLFVGQLPGEVMHRVVIQEGEPRTIMVTIDEVHRLLRPVDGREALPLDLLIVVPHRLDLHLAGRLAVTLLRLASQFPDDADLWKALDENESGYICAGEFGRFMNMRGVQRELPRTGNSLIVLTSDENDVGLNPSQADFRLTTKSLSLYLNNMNLDGNGSIDQPEFLAYFGFGPLAAASAKVERKLQARVGACSLATPPALPL